MTRGHSYTKTMANLNRLHGRSGLAPDTGQRAVVSDEAELLAKPDATAVI
jgi:hypothetical protein